MASFSVPRSKGVEADGVKQSHLGRDKEILFSEFLEILFDILSPVSSVWGILFRHILRCY